MYSKIPVFPLPCQGWIGIKERENNLNSCVYPTPVTDFLHIDAPGNETFKIVLYDITLRKTLQQEITGPGLINMRQYPKGIYIYEMWNNGELVRKEKIVKE